MNKQLLTFFAKDYANLRNEGYDSIDAYSTLRGEIRDSHDDMIWEKVDSPDNVEGLEFDDFLNEIMDEIEEEAEQYIK